MKSNSPDRAIVEAAEWLSRLRADDVTEKEMERFGDWLRDAPANVREYLEALAIWEDLTKVDSNIDVDALLTNSNVVTLTQQKKADEERAGRTTERRKLFIVAAMFLLSVTVAISWWAIRAGNQIQTIATQTGEQHSRVLEDGSVIHLNTQTRISISLNKSGRYVRLFNGEAYFDVAKDPVRPFTVTVDDTTIRVIGTRFNVRREEKAATVTVVEGKVSVRREIAGMERESDNPSLEPKLAVSDAIVLVPGQQTRISNEEPGVAPVPVNPQKFVAWTERRLIFENDSLDTIISEFNRYNLQRLEIVDPDLNNIRLTGIFDANDIDSFLELLKQTHGIQVRRSTGGQRRLIVAASDTQ